MAARGSLACRVARMHVCFSIYGLQGEANRCLDTRMFAFALRGKTIAMHTLAYVRGGVPGCVGCAPLPPLICRFALRLCVRHVLAATGFVRGIGTSGGRGIRVIIGASCHVVSSSPPPLFFEAPIALSKLLGAMTDDVRSSGLPVDMSIEERGRNGWGGRAGTRGGSGGMGY